MAYFLSGLGSATLGLLGQLLDWHLRSWRESWGSAWQGPYRITRFSGLVIGIPTALYFIPAVFDGLGLMSGISYLFAVYLAFSNATFFSIARVGRNRYFPLGAVAAVFILVGVIVSSAISPLISDAKDAAMAQDCIGALVLLVVFVVMMRCFRLWQSGNPY